MLGHNSKSFKTATGLSKMERKKLKDAILELDGSHTRVASERDLQKEIIDSVAEELDIEKKLVRKLARTYFKANYNTEKEEQQTFEDFYDIVINESGDE